MRVCVCVEAGLSRPEWKCLMSLLQHCDRVNKDRISRGIFGWLQNLLKGRVKIWFWLVQINTKQ